MSADLTERVRNKDWAHDLDCNLVRDAYDEDCITSRPCSCPVPALLREAAEQLAAKDAELANLKASLVELQPALRMACVPHCPVLNGYSGKHHRECRPVREA